MGILTADRQHIALRPLALPSEHGGWGFLLEPIALALIVAPSVAGGAVAIAALAGFLARHPLRLALIDLRRKRYARTAVCARLAIACSAVSIFALVVATHIAGPRVLLPLALASPLAAFQFVHDIRRRGRALAPEIAGVAAMGAIAASIAIAAEQSTALASALWCLALLRSIPAIVFVRAALGKTKRTAAIALHIFAVAASIALWRWSLVPMTAIIAMCGLLARAIISRSRVEPARSVGIRELGYGAATSLLAGFGYHFM
ncbi:MAG: YwiC-like family protein [Acidobacteriota bacterium]|nr:YwiC-like family protein [Acidobacteriota bacterium]